MGIYSFVLLPAHQFSEECLEPTFRFLLYAENMNYMQMPANRYFDLSSDRVLETLNRDAKMKIALSKLCLEIGQSEWDKQGTANRCAVGVFYAEFHPCYEGFELGLHILPQFIESDSGI